MDPKRAKTWAVIWVVACLVLATVAPGSANDVGGSGLPGTGGGAGPAPVLVADSGISVEDAGVHQPAVDALRASFPTVFDGTGCDGGLCPSEALQRWEMAVWLVRVLDRTNPSPQAGSRFADVAAGVWWAPYTDRLADLGVTAGCGTDPLRFCPNNSVTRAQMASFLVRAFGLETGPAAGFTDTARTVHAANIDAVAAAGITAGCKIRPLRYCPTKAVTRAQMATFLARALGLVPLPAVVEPTPMPDRIAYVSYGAIYVAGADGSDEKRLTIDNSNKGDDFVGDLNLAWHDSDPSWSPDGTQITFASSRFGENEILVMDSDGRNVRRLTRQGGASPDWSPDGTRIVFAGTGVHLTSKWRYGFDTTDSIFLMDPDGGNLQKLATGGGASPSWSPDGTRIVFARSTGAYTTDIFVMHSDGNNIQRLTYDGGRLPSWSPDGTRIAFTRNEEIFLMDTDGKNRRQLTSGGGWNPSWSPDGTRIAYESTHLFVNPYTEWDIYASILSNGIIVMNLDGTDLQRVADGSRSPAWAPSASTDRRPVAVPLGSPSEFTTVTAGEHHSCGTRTDSTLACWGNNNFGQASPPTGTFTAVAAGSTHSCGIRTNGTLVCWGDNYFGEASPPRSATFTAVATGFAHSCGIRTNRSMACWGGNDSGQASAPTGTFTAISAGDDLSCGIRTNRSLACWGGNDSGQASAPTGTFTAVATGSAHSCGIRSDRTAACWGTNYFGQASAPTGTFTAISAGDDLSCGIRTNGSITCWGGNDSGQASAPAGTFTAVATGSAHSCGIRSDRTAACWGTNYFGQGSPPPDRTGP